MRTAIAIPNGRLAGDDADLLRAIFDDLPAIVGYWDRDLRNRMANAAYLDWFGYTPEQMRGMRLGDLLGPDLYEMSRPFVEGVLAGEQQVFERTMTDQTGATRHTQITYIPDVVAGEVQGFIALVADITDRVHAESALERSAEQYRALVRSIPGGFVLLFDLGLRYRVAEGEALAAFGYEPPGLEGRTVVEAHPREVANELAPLYRKALAGESVSWDHEAGDRLFGLTAGPVRDEEGHVFAGTVVCIDVTTERRAAAVARALRAIATLIAGNATVDEVVTVVADRVHDVFNIEQAAVVRFDGAEWGRVVALNPPIPGFDPELTFGPGDSSATAAVLRTGAAAAATYDAGSEGTAAALYGSGIVSGAAAPIRIRGELWGAVGLGSSRHDAIEGDTLDRLASFAEMVEIAIGSAAAWNELTRQATTDPVSGLPNHRSFHEQLAREIGETRRSGRPLSVVLLDLDHFKRVNDTFGHPVGDRIIAEVGHRLDRIRRGHEVVARIGGEEFAWLLPDAAAEDAVDAAERARAAISEEPFGQVGTLTISAGVCDLDSARAPEHLIEDADRALYAAKRAGRNRTVRAAPRSRPRQRPVPPKL